MLSYLSVDWQHPVDWQHGLNQGLVGWWLNVPHRRGGTTWRDLTGRHFGTLTDMDPATDWVGPGSRRGGWGSLDFDGSTDHVPVAPINSDNFKFTSHFSVAFWLNTRTIAQFDIQGVSNCTNAGTGYRFWTRDSSNFKYYWEVYDGAAKNVVSDTLIVNTDWTYIVGTHDGTNIHLYVNGIEEGTPTAAGNVDYTFSGRPHLAMIGAMPLANDATTVQRVTDGQIDDVRFYSRDLSAAEVADSYERSMRGYPGLLYRPTRRYYIPAAVVGGGTVPYPIRRRFASMLAR